MVKSPTEQQQEKTSLTYVAVFLSVEMGNQLTLKKEWHVVLRLKPNYKSHDFAELSGL